MSVNAIDGLVLLVVLFGVWRGFRIGFVRALYALLALGLEFAVASALKRPIADLVAPALPMRLPDEALEPAAFLVAFSVAGLALGLVGATAIRLIAMAVRRMPLLGALDRGLGTVPSAAHHLLLAAGMIAILGLFAPADSVLGRELRTSTVAPIADVVYRRLSETGANTGFTLPGSAPVPLPLPLPRPTR